MRVTVLVDNNTLIDRYFVGEPGFSALIEEGGMRALFDLGYSGAFLANAMKMGIDLTDLDYVAVSHGHLDHTWGLESLVRHYTEKAFEGCRIGKPVMVGNPQAFKSIGWGECGEIGSLLSEAKLERHFRMSLKEEPQWLSDRCVFLGRIPRENVYEGKTAFGRREGEEADDLVEDDSAIVYKGSDGLVIITGCAHSGICNIAEYAMKICGETRIQDIIGGLHLQKPSREQLEGTLRYFGSVKIDRMHPCHCTDLKSKIALAQVVEVEETGVGTRLEYA